ncbi:P2 family phage major capsid protein, partial [Salmonella enterica subsp. enterica serovar Virginia]|nr:P2 family phage major capsid protein [Salmonella enterica subsp. enterica serovar Virginia]
MMDAVNELIDAVYQDDDDLVVVCGRELLSDKYFPLVNKVAGLGTRMLPATKAIPKEMLPLVDKPLIQYVVNECIAAGITE